VKSHIPKRFAFPACIRLRSLRQSKLHISHDENYNGVRLTFLHFRWILLVIIARTIKMGNILDHIILKLIMLHLWTVLKLFLCVWDTSNRFFFNFYITCNV